MWGGSRAVAARGLAAGAASVTFTLRELAAALQDLPRDTHTHTHTHPGTCVYVTSDGAGAVTARGGAARAALSARLAPHGLATTALLQLHDHDHDHQHDHDHDHNHEHAEDAGVGLRLVVTSPLAPHAELLLWPDEALLARLGVPVLTPLNIHERAVGYVCHLCPARYSQPNALKLHVWLGCAPPAPRAVWRRVLALLAPAPALCSPSSSPAHAQAHTARALEALAARWAQARGGRGATGHVCVYCGKVYSRRYGLKIHVRTHTGYKPLRCRHCARAFGDPSNLNKHLRLHEPAAGGGGAGRHRCARCGAALARRRDLERHERAAHCGGERAA